MIENGFWVDGPDEHRRALEQRLRVLRKRLENCDADRRKQILQEISGTQQEMRDADDGQILW